MDGSNLAQASSTEVVIGSGLALPELVLQAGEPTAKRFVEYFTVTIRNPNTRVAYARAVVRFLEWCRARGLALQTVEPIHVAAYVEHLSGKVTTATVKQHLAALKQMLAWLVTGGMLPDNPAINVKGPSVRVSKGKTPVLSEQDARALLNSIAVDNVIGLRDRALISVMLYSFARISAVLGMRVRDYRELGNRASFILHEKGGKHHAVPAHSKAAAAVQAYIDGAGLAEDKDGPLFRSSPGHSRALTDNPMDRTAVLRMVKRRSAQAGLGDIIGNHTFRATGITAYIKGGGTLETAAQIAAHASTKTTQLYNRTSDEVEQSEIERIRI